jgi:hypothetical protein
MSAQAVVSNPTSLRIAMAELYRREPVLVAFAAINIALMLPSFVGLLADTRTFNGINVWIKPLKFQSSVALFLLTFALFWPYLDKADRGRKAVRFSVWFVSIVSLLEVLYITYRGALAEGSHFNNTTLRDEILYAVMGLGIVSTSVFSAWLGWRILRARDVTPHADLRSAIGLGLVAGVVLGALTGMYMSGQTSHWVGGLQSDAGGSFLFGWSRTGGDLRVAHFAGLHAMQGIPLIGWLAARYLPANVRGVTIGATVAWSIVTLAIFVQAIMGRPLFPL